jgi:hypothetical protein
MKSFLRLAITNWQLAITPLDLFHLSEFQKS